MRVGLGLGTGVAALALLLCARALAQTPAPDPAPLPQPPPPASEPSTPPPAEAPSTSNAHPRKDDRGRREHRKKPPEVVPFHPSTAEAGPTVLAPQAGLVNTRQVLAANSAENGSLSPADGPRPVVIALAIVLVLTAGVLLLVFVQY